MALILSLINDEWRSVLFKLF